MSIPLNIDWQQILLHLFNFAILAVGLYLLLYKPVKNFMDKRTAYYEELDASAKQKLREAERMNADCQEKLALAGAETSQKKAEAARELELFHEKEIAAAKEEANGILVEAREKAAREREKMIEDSQAAIAEMAISAARKICEKNISEEQQEALFEEILTKAGENCGV